MADQNLPQVTAVAQRRTAGGTFKRAFRRNWLVAAGSVFVVLLMVIAVVGPLLTTHDATEVDLFSRLSAPSGEHLLGTDQYGRDIYSRIVLGTRVSLLVGIVATGLASIAGVLLGALSGWLGGWVDSVLMRVMDVLMAFPTIVVAIALAAVFGPGLDKLILIIGFSRMPEFARLSRATVISIRDMDYISAATALGKNRMGVLFKHALPNSLAPLLVYASASIATAINTEAALSFLGLGIQSPAASWGSMLSDARQYMLLAPWLALFPGAAITLTVLAFNLVGDGVRDLIDPRLRGRG